jgi:DNA-binding response OmpR family regulator
VKLGRFSLPIKKLVNLMPKTILFIEDESALQKTFGDILRKEGYQMISALDGEIGLKLAKGKTPDLILLDLILPKIHGFDVLKKLKEDEETKEIPVIVLTNLEALREIDKAIELGARTYLVKTQYSLEEVVEKIKKALEK